MSFGLFRRNVNLDFCGNVREEFYFHRIDARRFDRFFQNDFLLVDFVTCFGKPFRNLFRSHAAENLSVFSAFNGALNFGILDFCGEFFPLFDFLGFVEFFRFEFIFDGVHFRTRCFDG